MLGEYRTNIFEMIPSLQSVDGANVNGEDVDDSLDGDDGVEGEDSGDEYPLSSPSTPSW